MNQKFFQFAHTRRRAFTLIEMMVAVSILVLIILSIGVVFRGAGQSVGVSQASLEMLSNVRAVQQQLERDVSGIDKNSFLVIRCGICNNKSVTPNLIRRCDQVSFISRGSFPHRTGTINNRPFADTTTTPTAFVWWGQLAMEKVGSSWTASDVINPSKFLPAAPETTQVLLNQVPTGIIPDLNALHPEPDYTLGRSTMILAPQDVALGSAGSGVQCNISPTGTSIPAFANQPPPLIPPISAIDYSAKNAGFSINGQTEVANITQSRVDAAATTPSEIMSYLTQALGIPAVRSGANNRYEADHYCYRFAALHSPYDGTDPAGNLSLVNGYFRMHPIALQGVSSFAVDWTDGSTYTGTETDVITGQKVLSTLIGATKWYGLYNDGTTVAGQSKAGVFAQYFVDHATSGAVDATSNGDDYTAIFSYDTPSSQWPVALRFRFHVADPSGRLANGRDFVQVVNLPQ
jgi:prepilin-type N-terminal cleavage/methylation domain-containing protein